MQLFYPPEMGGMSATVSPSWSGRTAPGDTYSSLSASVTESSSSTVEASLGYCAANKCRTLAVLACDEVSSKRIWLDPVASRDEAKKRTVIVVVVSVVVVVIVCRPH